MCIFIQQMKLFRYIPAILSFCIGIGILFGYYFRPNNYTIIILLFSSLIVLFLTHYITSKSFEQRYYFNLVAYLLFIFIGIASITFQDKRNQKNHYSNYLVSDSNQFVLEITKELNSNIYYNKYFAKVIQTNTTNTVDRILLNIRKDSLNKEISVSNVIYVKTKLQKINKPLNPYQFDYQGYLNKQQIHYQTTIGSNELRVIKKTIRLRLLAHNIRKKIQLSLKKNGFKADELAIINAILLGQRKDISKNLMQNYAKAGAIHILAVSGLHIGILLLLLNFVFSPLEFFKKSKVLKIILVIILLWMYAFLAGLSASIVRAVTMFTAISIGGFINKKTSTVHSLFISIFILLLVNPSYLFSVGFQLSYLAVFSIVHFYPLFIEIYQPKNKVLRYFWSIFTVSLAAQIGILPISLYYFHQFPSLFFISSMVIIPFLGLILGIGIVVILLALTNLLPIPISQFFSWVIQQMNIFISFIAKQEMFLFKHIHFSFWMLFVSYIFILAFYFLWKKPNPFKIVAVLVSIILFQTVLIFEKHQIETSNEFIVFNKSKTRLIVQRTKKNATVYTEKPLKNNYIIANYSIGKGLKNQTIKPLKNLYSFGGKTILVIDSLGIYKIPKLKIDYVLLQQSPKINLKRLLVKLKPKTIIADGSNYKSYKKQWSKTCKKVDVPFYDTSISGAFHLKE